MATEIITTPGSTEGLKETLVSDIKGIVGKADHLLKDASHSVAGEFSAVRHAVSDKACCAATATNDYVHGNPWKFVGMAAAAGIFIGALISRR